ncbi:MAG: lipopolysaccharide biosynthesis protein [Methylophilus sp.]
MKKLFVYMGVDRAVAYTLMGRGWGLLSGVLTLLLVARFLTPDEQGYYYTFASLLAMQIFFELGMSVVVTQFVSHEMAHLSWLNNNTVEGDVNAKDRLHSLLLLVVKWYGVIAALIVLVILPIGWIFFSVTQSQSQVNWQVAWSWLVIVSAVNIFLVPMQAVMEGCGRITEIAKLRMFQNLFSSLCAWVVLILGGGLLAMPVMSTCSAFSVVLWLWTTKRAFFSDFMSRKMTGVSIKWKKEIWPFQWRIAVSWLSGYFIFQLFTPVLFAYKGAEEAGRMGMSISLANALTSIALAWMSTKSPGFGTLIANKDYVSLDKVFILTLSRSLIVIAVISVLLSMLNYFMHIERILLASRLLDPLPFTLLMITTVINYITYAQSTYLRAHKQEPFLLISVISALLIGVLTFCVVREYGSVGIMSSFLAVSITIGLGWGSLIFSSKRRSWQKHSIT